MPHSHLELLCVTLPVLVTAFLPSSFAGFTSKFIIFGLLVWLVREVRLSVREFLIGRKSIKSGGRLAPKVYSALPFGLSIILHRIRAIANGTPETILEDFKAFPEGTEVIRTRCLGTETLMTLSHLDAKHVFTTGFAKWGKSPNLKDAFRPFLGEGMFISDQRGLWSWHRSMIRPHFSRERVATDACVEHADRVINWLEGKVQIEEAVDVQDVFSRLTLTIGTQHIFGHCVDMLNDLLDDRQLKADRIDGALFSRAFADSQEYCLKILLLPPFIARLVHAIRPARSNKIVIELAKSLVRKTESKKPTDPEDEVESEKLVEHLRRSGASSELIREQTLNVMLAARDTTASLLTSCVYELAGRDELWTKLRDELPPGLDLSDSLEELRKLKLLRAVINETLRLHSPVWVNFRHALEDDVLPSGTFVPAGSDCNFYIRHFHRDPKLWGKDADVFVPERWMDGRQVNQSKDPSIFQPFGLGPRYCVGQQFAYTEVTIMLAKLLRAFSSVELAAERDSIQEVPGLILSVRGGLWVKFRK